MALELVSFGIQKLWDLLSQEYEKFEGVDDQVIELKRELNLLSSFLKDAYAKKHTSAVVRNCVEEIKEIVYDAEDIIETYIIKEELGKTSGIKKSIRRIACIVSDRRENALDIGGIRKRISNVIRDMQSFGVQQIIADGGYMQHVHDRLREMRQTFPRDYESDLVGLEESVQKLVTYLVEEDNIQVVSITGMGGVGKTTLARQIFNHGTVKHKFDGIAWVCISQEFERLHVWQAILQNLRPKEEKDGILQMQEAILQGELFRLLETSKSLIVLDDIWKEEDWDRIKPIFPPGKGWKVLLTSRNESVAVRGDATYINFKPQCLTVEESWKLFQKIAFPRKDLSESKVDKEMEEMGKQMINHCGGLPLAVKVLGGLLSTKYTLHDWKRLSKNITSHIVGKTDFNDSNDSSVYYVLSLSFEELPIYLKHCFLYLAHFPEDYPINVEKLSYYWAAEGIPKPRYYDGATIRDVADGYIEELVGRNVVIAERDVRSLRFETFHLHDMMREVCLAKAKEENFLQLSVNSSPTAHSQSPCRSRRLVFHGPTKLHITREIKNPKLRSLLVMSDIRFHLSREIPCMLPSVSFTRLQLLRLLDLSNSKFEGGKLPSSIGNLIHLRYLSLEKSMVSHLPYSLRNLKLLIYLNLDVKWDFVIYMPDFFMGMRELRYLSLPWALSKKTKLDLSNLVNLETLKNFLTRNCSFGDLHGMTNFKTLEISFYHGMSVETISSSVGGLRNLENLTIIDHRANRFDANIIKGFVLDCIHLNKLDLKIYMPKLPDVQHFPSRLKTITLTECCLEEDPMPILEKLFQLKEVHLMYQSFRGKRMVCSGNGFPQLQFLSIFELQEWEEWIVEESSMPLLHTLTIGSCKKLKELPDGMRYITSLKELYIGMMQTEWKERLSERGADYYKVQHIPSVYLRRY